MKALSWHLNREGRMFWLRVFGWGFVVESRKNFKHFSERYNLTRWYYVGPIKLRGLKR